MTARSRRTRRLPVLLAALGLLLAACAGDASGGDPANGGSTAGGTVTLYTCIDDSAVQPVIAAFEKRYPQTRVELFRAPTGQLNARVAADVRSGGLRADVVWACDPMTQQAYVTQGLVGGWTPPDAGAVPARYRTPDYVGAALLYVVAVHRTDVPAPRTWSDLTGPAYTGGVALPDPSVAASALGALGWFLGAPGYGSSFYQALRTNGAVQVSTPDDVTTGVAQGRYRAGMTVATSAYAAKKAGSPVDVAWPEPGAIAIYEPIAVARHSAGSAAARDLVGFVVGPEGQRALASGGSYPTLPGIAGPEIPAGAPVVHPDWAAFSGNRVRILGDNQRVFGG